MKWHIWPRKFHRWGAALVALPFLLVLGTGLFLQMKKFVPWVQPPTQRGSAKEPSATWEQLLAAVRDVPEAEVQSWADLDRLDVRPRQGVIKMQCKNLVEVQLDAKTAQVLQVAPRRSDVIESLHDGSFFGSTAKDYVFLPIAVVVLGLWFTGVFLLGLPWWVRLRRRRAPPAAETT